MTTPAYAEPQCIGLGDGGGVDANGIKDGCWGVCIHEGNTRQDPNWDLRTKPQCDGGPSTNKWIWDQNATFGCEILSATFNPPGDQAADWYKGENTTPVRVDVVTKNCVGTTVEISITEIDSATGIFDDDIHEIDNKPIVIPSNTFSVNLKAGESECETAITGNAPECVYYIRLNNFSSKGKSRGELSYNCKGLCDVSGDDWQWLGLSPIGVSLYDPNVKCRYKDPNSMSFKDVPFTVGQSPSNEPCKQSASTDTTYTPLATLPGLDTKINTTDKCAFGKYLNIMINLIIGLIAIGAMVMIVIGGLEYMTSELISSKDEGRKRIQNAILGLVIALGSYLLLNTINPDLLNVCLDKLPQATIEIDNEPESSPWTGVANLTSPTGNCTQGYTNVAASQGGQPSTINVCKSISSNLTNMITAAKNSGIVLSGWGSRTNTQQVALRQQHGCPDNNSPSSACTPPTARPGHSKHESGKAVDFNCNGATMAGSNCFNWLKANAGAYHFYNFPAEPWHWSDDGR